MKHWIYILARLLNWLIVLYAGFQIVNLSAYAGDWHEMHVALPDHITLMLIASWGVYVFGLIPLWFYPKSQVTHLQRRFGLILAGIEIPFALALAWAFWHYRMEGVPFSLAIPLAAPLVINAIGLLVMRSVKQ